MLLSLTLILSAANVKVASVEWTHSGVDTVFASTLEARFLDLLGSNGVQVISPKDVAAVLGLERQRQMMGCDVEASCIAELGGALGVDAIMYASVVKAGTGITATVRVIRSRDARVVASYSERVKNEDSLQDWLDAKARALNESLRAAFRKADGEHAGAVTVPGVTVAVDLDAPVVGDVRAPQLHPFRRWLWGSGALAVVGAVGLAVGMAQADSLSRQLSVELRAQHTVTPKATALANSGRTMELVGFIGLGAAIAGLGASALFYLFESEPPLAPAVAWSPGQSWFGVEAHLP